METISKALAPDRSFRNRMIVMAGLFVLLNAIDIWLTLIILNSGYGIEANSIMAWILTLPLASVLTIKIGLSFICAATIVLLADRYPAHCRRILLVLVIGMLVVLAVNTATYIYLS